MILYHLGVNAKSLPKWSADPHWVMFTIVLFSVWKNMGYYMVIYLAGLQGINGELYEAAALTAAIPGKGSGILHGPSFSPPPSLLPSF